MEIQNIFFGKEMSLYTNDKSNAFVFPPIFHELNFMVTKGLNLSNIPKSV